MNIFYPVTKQFYELLKDHPEQIDILRQYPAVQIEKIFDKLDINQLAESTERYFGQSVTISENTLMIFDEAKAQEDWIQVYDYHIVLSAESSVCQLLQRLYPTGIFYENIKKG